MRTKATIMLLATAAAAAVPAAAGAASDRVANGYYSALGDVPSALVSFHVHTGQRVPDLVLECDPLDDSLGSAVAVHAPATSKVKHGKLTYDGPAKITGPTGDATETLAQTTLKLSLKHVRGPVRHYTYEGRHLKTTTAWTGTVSSPGCKTLGHDGRVKLYGKSTEE